MSLTRRDFATGIVAGLAVPAFIGSARAQASNSCRFASSETWWMATAETIASNGPGGSGAAKSWTW